MPGAPPRPPEVMPVQAIVPLRALCASKTTGPVTSKTVSLKSAECDGSLNSIGSPIRQGFRTRAGANSL
jgi:hypothetical protein